MSGVVMRHSTLSERTVRAGLEVLASRRRGWRAALPFAGPAVIASIAYVDPGNFATNIQAGSMYGYMLLWVVVLANVVAMLFQALSAKLGIVTGKSLAELCRDRYPRPVVIAMWLVSEVAAMATDLAEFLGAGIGLSLLFGWPLLACLAITGVITYAILALNNRSFRGIELVIAAFVTIIGVCYVIEILIAPPAWGQFFYHSVVPQLADANSVTLAVGIVGATVMPHVLYLHSTLTQNRMPVTEDRQRRMLIGFSHREVLIALGIAGLVNMAMLTMAATTFHTAGQEVSTIESAYHTLVPLLGVGAAAVFMISLLASGVSSSVVGTMAGQAIMRDFVHFRIPIWLRRLVTMAPAFVVVAMGVDGTETLIISQVVLSLILPVPMIALLLMTGNRAVMGTFTNRPVTQTIAWIVAALVLLLNVVLVAQTLGVPVPFLG
jgi:manganese transport protein